MYLTIIDYGSGNLRSVENAFSNAITDNNLKCKIRVTSDIHIIANADLLVLPGVGSFPDCRNGLQNIPDTLYDYFTHNTFIRSHFSDKTISNNSNLSKH